MTSTRTRKPAPKKRRTTGKKKKSASRFSSGAGISRIILLLVLIIFLFVSIGVAGYVIFFRVVVAVDLDHGCQAPIALGADRAGSKSDRGEAEDPKAEDGVST